MIDEKRSQPEPPRESSQRESSKRESSQRESSKKENNPFSEQEKHGDQAQRRVPAFQQEYQGGQPEKRPAPGADHDQPERRKKA
jgi:hypothetical protein